MIRLGPGGTDGKGYDVGIAEAAKLGLSAMEVEFTYGVKMKDEDAVRIGKLAAENGITLSVHAPYYVNLASDDLEKVNASVTRIIDSCYKAHLLGAKYVVFHAGFYQGSTAEETFLLIKEQIIKIMAHIDANGWKVKLAPETTGKASQFGSLEELVRLHNETGCHICVDFAHLIARNQGSIDYDYVMKMIKPFGHLHAHFSGIEWTSKGEKKHIITEEGFIRPLAEAILKHGIDITIINESPQPFVDAAKVKAVFEQLS